MSSYSYAYGFLALDRWRVFEVIKAMHPFDVLTNDQAHLLTKLPRHFGISQISDLWDEDTLSRHDMEACLLKVGGISPWLLDTSIAFLDEIKAMECPSLDLEVNASIWE